MPWLLVDLALVLLAVVALGLVALRLWRGVRALGREVTVAGRLLGTAGEELSRLQAPGAHASPRTPPSSAPRTAPRRPARR